ncbi:glycosyltransferase [uncultured Psychroserpens sp.]|uniref:glycosyltransferase n=1 Tax=uncultured Psychroserpens sp. TaxID=255436 RepID=UPI00263549ED|nr:glycosyltransferase [uncultured Psychroserpens sp.]
MDSSKSQIKKLYYISPRDMRKNRADAVHMMYSCAAFSNHGIDVELITPKVQRKDYTLENNDIFSLYDVPENFKITELNTKIREVNNKSSAIVVLMNRFVFNFMFILQHLSVFRHKHVVVYSKCYTSVIPYIILKFFGLIRCKLVFETPFLSNNNYHKFIMKRMHAIVVMTSHVEEFLVNTFKIPKEKIIKSPVRFQTDYQDPTDINKAKHRNYLNWENDIKYVVYAGKTGGNLKRIQVFAEASDAFENTKFVIVGATEGLQNEYKNKDHKNLILYPFQTYPEYLKFVQAADVLVATYEDTFYNRYTLSPGKGGAYLQSENPVIFTDLPCLKERFPNDLVSFVVPDDSQDLIEKITHILDHYKTYKEQAKKGANFVSNKTFTDASAHILKKLNYILFS